MMKKIIRICLAVLLVGMCAPLVHGDDRPGGEDGPSPMLLAILENAGVKTDSTSLLKAADAHPDSIVRWAAIEILALRQETGARKALRKIMEKDLDRVVRETAALALARMGAEEGLAALKVFVENPADPKSQLHLAARLAELGDACGYEHVVRAAQSEEVAIRAQVIEALIPFLSLRSAELAGRIDPGDLLLRMADDGSPEVRRQFLTFVPMAVRNGLEMDRAIATVQRISQSDPEASVREAADLLLGAWHLEECQRNPDKGECP